MKSILTKTNIAVFIAFIIGGSIIILLNGLFSPGTDFKDQLDNNERLIESILIDQQNSLKSDRLRDSLFKKKFAYLDSITNNQIDNIHRITNEKINRINYYNSDSLRRAFADLHE